jgi:hypothetical protein
MQDLIHPLFHNGKGDKNDVSMNFDHLNSIEKAKVLLILPCNAAACVGNYFMADFHGPSRWNVWREADTRLKDIRKEGLVAFAAVDSSILETQPDDPRGAIVLETEMDRAKNPDGKDWGAPSWRYFRPTSSGKWQYLEELTGALVRGVKRVQSMDFLQVLALVNPRGYFLALAAAARECGVFDQWVFFRTPAHPDYLISAIREVTPIIKAAASNCHLRGGIYPIPDLYHILKREAKFYKDKLPDRWKEGNWLPNLDEVEKLWKFLVKGET